MTCNKGHTSIPNPEKKQKTKTRKDLFGGEEYGKQQSVVHSLIQSHRADIVKTSICAGYVVPGLAHLVLPASFGGRNIFTSFLQKPWLCLGGSL